MAIPLRISMLIMAFFLVVCGLYRFFEALICFKETKTFGVISKEIFAIIEGAIALMVAVDFIVKKKCYTIILYLLTLALAGFCLASNIYKTSIINERFKTYEIKHKLVQCMYVIRIGAELIIQLVVCYLCYSYKKDL